MPTPYATAYSNVRGFSMRFEEFKISVPTMLPSLSCDASYSHLPNV